jgi:hypothetical protein
VCNRRQLGLDFKRWQAVFPWRWMTAFPLGDHLNHDELQFDWRRHASAKAIDDKDRILKEYDQRIKSANGYYF